MYIKQNHSISFLFTSNQIKRQEKTKLKLSRVRAESLAVFDVETLEEHLHVSFHMM